MTPDDIARVDVTELDYADFLDRFVVPARPVILTGIGADWPARSAWSLRSLLERVRPNEEVLVRMFRPQSVSIGKGTLDKVLREILEPSPRDYRLYLSNWHFYQTHPELAEDYRCPDFFRVDHSAAFQAGRLQWLYLGEADTGTPTHLDVLRSSAWLYLFEGEKHWRFLTGPQVRRSLDEDTTIPDLFAPETIEDSWDASYQAGVQRAGELVWSPHGSLHAVHNATTTLALTHNYVDLSNVVTVLGSPGLGETPGRGWISDPVALMRWLDALVEQTRSQHDDKDTREQLATIIRSQLDLEALAPRRELEAAITALLTRR